MEKSQNLDGWSVAERLRFIELCAYWRGEVQRQDLAGRFGLSMAQASADLQEYQRVNAGALGYNLRKKRYEGSREMVLAYGAAALEEAMQVFLASGEKSVRPCGRHIATATEGSGGQVYSLPLPTRSAAPHVERRVFMAVAGGLRLRVLYFSVDSGEEGWRWLRPRAFVDNGSRWHLRAWCETRHAWRDFNLSRIGEAEWPVACSDTVPPDAEGEELVTLRLRAHSRLAGGALRAVQRDYGMDAEGMLTLTVPRLLERYVRSRLHLSGEVAALLEEVPPVA